MNFNQGIPNSELDPANAPNRQPVRENVAQCTPGMPEIRKETGNKSEDGFPLCEVTKCTEARTLETVIGRCV